MTVDDSVMQKLWKLTNELTAQLVFNRNATLELKQQLADLQAKTAQGPISITQGIPAYNPQEHADWSLRIANERLQEENAQLQEQLREYERWMEFIMTKFRLQNFAMAQSRKEALHDAYRMAEQEGELAAKLQEENAVLQARLVDVGAVARKAISEEYYNTESIIETLEMENQGLREMLGVATDHMNTMANAGNRVSFPSTGSYAASSGSDREPMHPNHERERNTAVMTPPTPAPTPTVAATAAMTTTSATHGAPTTTAANETAVSLAKQAAQMSLYVAEGGTTPKANIASVTDISTAPEKGTEKSTKPIAGSGTKKKADARTGSTPALSLGTLAKDGKGGMTINTTMAATKKSTSTSNSSSSNSSNSQTSNGTTTSSSTSKNRKPARKTKV